MTIAVVLFNLGGPDRPESVEPFLFNLFSDPAIIGLPGILRRPLARLIARRRAPIAREIYAKMGGGSPIVLNTDTQARALETRLHATGVGARTFIAMRYWHPFADETARAVAAMQPERVVLLPLYPQYSTTTTASSLASWNEAARAAALDCETRAVCCYPAERGFIEALAGAIREKLAGWTGPPPRLLLSAHGLPKKVIRRGDPYQWQVERAAAALAAALGDAAPDWVVCYQSRVGPLEWIGPSTDAEIRRAGEECKPVLVAPIAFVSEHSETLVELDIEYRHLAEAVGVPRYGRVPTVSAREAFIDGLVRLVKEALERPAALAPHGGVRICAAEFARCPIRPRTSGRKRAAP